ncbi:MAG: hypothetical protein WAM30_10125, partial [Candidatus Dormiibacterota bacterium]
MPRAERLETAVFHAGVLPDEAVLLIAMVPPVVAGLLLFRLPALLTLVIALAAGGAVWLLARIARWPGAAALFLSSLLAVALLGGGASPVLVIAIALLAAVLQLVRSRFARALRIEPALVAFAAALVAVRSRAMGYLVPFTAHPAQEPVRVWLAGARHAAPPDDLFALYVGNVPGPVFATSLLAVCISAAWLWHARRLSLLALAGFAAGALAAILFWRWPIAFSLDSGPLWFGGALLLAPAPLLPRRWYLH